MFENPFAKKFLHTLNPAYTPPSRKTVSGPLLDSAYTFTKIQVDAIIATLPNINIVTDESSNIAGSRICNISVHSPSGSLHYISEDIKVKQMTVAVEAQWLRNHLLTLSKGDLFRINSITTDTCATMFATWQEVQRFEKLKHCLFISCDSHGIQLLIKDLLQLPTFKEVSEKAQTIVKAFRRALLQYARLREFQREYGNKSPQSLILSVITCWGTQLHLIQSVLNSKDALRRYAHEFGSLPPIKRIKQEVIDIIYDDIFWYTLESLRELLHPLDEALKMSEDSNSHLGHVLPRWMRMAEHLRMKPLYFPVQLQEFMSVDNGGFAQRYKRQIMPLHVTAHYLIPEKRAASLPENFNMQLQSIFRQFTSNDVDYETLNYEFEAYRAQEPPFEPGRRCWTLFNKSKLFWHATMSHSNLLGKLAYRIFSTPCNSVASERAFSTQNLIHTKTRNRLKPETTNKLTYIYINARILHSFDELAQFPMGIKARHMHELTAEEEVMIENVLLGIEMDENGTIMDIDKTGGESNARDVDEEDEDAGMKISILVLANISLDSRQLTPYSLAKKPDILHILSVINPNFRIHNYKPHPIWNYSTYHMNGITPENRNLSNKIKLMRYQQPTIQLTHCYIP
jgi:hypothetical protein